MPLREWACTTVFVSLLIAPTELHAGGGDRAGQFASLGIGGGATLYNRTFTDLQFPDLKLEETKTKSGGGIALDFKLGGGLSRVTWLYFASRSTRFGSHSSSLMALGVTRFLGRSAPSLYMSGLFGIAQWFEHGVTTPFQAIFSGADGTGMGVGVGIGYEFVRHLSLEATVTFAQPNDVQPTRETENSLVSFLVTIQATAY
jgi:hypothetical protein